MDQPRIERALRLLPLLIGNRRNTNELAEILDTKVRNVQRYIDTFRAAGFIVEYHSRGIPYLNPNDGRMKKLSDLVHFTEEEAYILHKAIDGIDDGSTLKQNLKAKLYNIYHYPWLADVIVKPGQGENVHALIEAIEDKRCAVLKNYRSSNSNTVEDRQVEPYSFTTNYQQVWCFEPASKSSKLFKVSRIGEVEVLANNWQNEKLHQLPQIDVFRISGHDYIGKAELKLNIRAYNLLVEEYPLAEQYVNCQNHNSFIFSAPVCSYEGVGRFILGLYTDIQILGDEKLKAFIHEKINYLIKYNDRN
ncbi:MAG TPA: WYL domain-containing protein [Bacteroidales bacterium]|nr:WYL domain-containing protein [Bacteroidales bacterium]